ncbi:MAG: hypothetical protein IKA83_02465 [Paludibacteraceae bacterium]|nr:hypothetical protein [Paludibacteraceae bacterium]
MKSLNLRKVALNTEVQHYTDELGESQMTVQMPNGNSLHVNTTTGRVVSTTGNKVDYHGKLTVLQFVALQMKLLTYKN